VLIDWDKLAYPYLDPETPVLDAVLQRAKTDGVDLVMVAGEVVYEGGRFTRGRPRHRTAQNSRSLQHALADDEVERRQLSKALLPHVRRFYAGYFDPKPTFPIIGRARGYERSGKRLALLGQRLRGRR
jgi:5-methylthioadenosine/S-adenosylhomocysteine deaminase